MTNENRVFRFKKPQGEKGKLVILLPFIILELE